MKHITVEDCRNLKKKFEKYCETAEQHEFVMLLITQFNMDETIKQIEKDGEVKNQKDVRAMFRVVLSLIGEDKSEYEEESD